MTNSETTNSKFGLHWEVEHDEILDYYSSHSIQVKKINSKCIFQDKSRPNHKLIQGENIAALLHLQKEYQAKIDLIYIDPPYNTGFKKDQEGFIYHDQRKKQSHSYSHSDWLNFMHSRLTLAKPLLTESGLIFISIDEHEFAHLKLLCDEIFGEENFMNYLLWKKRGTGGQVKHGSIISQTEFIFIYAKNAKKASLNKIENPNAGKQKWRDFRKSGGSWQKQFRPKQHFPFYYNSEKDSLSLTRINMHDIEIIPQDSKGEHGFWENGLETTIKRLENRELKVKFNPKTNAYKIIQLEQATETQNAGNFLDIPSVQGTNEIKQLDLSFNNVKPLSLLQYIIEIGSKSDSIVLDFFAGSGSTCHAVIEMNENPTSKRTCIVVTNNEYDICETVTYPRLQRVLQGYTNQNDLEISAKKDNLEYYLID